MPLLELDVHVGRPLVRGRLTLFPVWNGRAVTSRGYDVHSPAVQVQELAAGPSVGQLVVGNAGPRPVLVLEGELLEGGHQHRVLERSAVVEAGASVPLPVSCVEQGRWHGGRVHERGGRRAPTNVRAAADQSRVWQEVGRFEDAYAASPTHSYLDAVAPAVGRAEDLVRGVRPLPFQSGLLAGVGGQPLLLEVYDSPRTLAAVWPGLLQALAVDALSAEQVPTPGRRARRFVDRVTAGGVAADGDHLRGRSPYAQVDSLVWRRRLVHTVALNRRHDLVAA
ncbi:MAG TPA: DUF6569 family protein [Mycobacteriales bacterium]|nr:DUF6569 family protein [Mycobacteriales bacterium]